MARVPSLESLFNSLKNKLREVLRDSSAVVSPGIPITDLGVIVPFNELERLYLITEFISRASTPTSFLSLLRDTEFIERFKTYFGLSDETLNSLFLHEAERIFYPFTAIRGSKSYVEIELILPAGVTSVTFSYGSPLYPKTVFYIGGKSFELLGAGPATSELVTFTSSTNRVSIVVVSTERLSLNVPTGSAVSVLGYGSELVMSGTVTKVLSSGSYDETVEEFLVRVAAYYNSGFLDSIGVLSNILANEGFKAKIYKFGQPGFSPRRYGIDVWVAVPYFPVNRGDTLIGPPAYYGSLDIPNVNPANTPNRYPEVGSIFHIEENIPDFNPIIGHLQSLVYDYSFFGTTPRDHILVRMIRPIFVNKIVIGETVFRSGADVPRAKLRIEEKIKDRIQSLDIGQHLDFSDVNAIIYSDLDVDYSSGVMQFVASKSPTGNESVISANSKVRGVLSDEFSKIYLGLNFVIDWPTSSR